MKKPVTKPRKKFTRAHAKKIYEKAKEVYEYNTHEELFILAYMLGKKIYPNYHYKICTRCFKLLETEEFQINRGECRSCRANSI